MYRKQFALLAVVCLIQAIHGETVLGVMKEYRPLVKELAMKIRNTAEESSVEMSSTNKIMEAHNEESWKTVHARMVEMKMMVDEAVKEAGQTGKDIERCVAEIHKEMQDMDMVAMKNCYPSEDMMAVKNAIENMKRMEGTTNKIPKTCWRQFPWIWQTEKLRNCMDEAMHGMEEGMAEEQTAVSKGLKNALKMNDKCVRNASKAMMKAMNNMAKTFKKCVKKA